MTLRAEKSEIKEHLMLKTFQALRKSGIIKNLPDPEKILQRKRNLYFKSTRYRNQKKLQNI